MDWKRSLGWIVAGLIAWYAVRIVSPSVAGLILAALVIGAVVTMGPQLAQLPKQ